MLEIVKGRNWAVPHSVLDDDETPVDLSVFTNIACQIREKDAVKNAKGFFEHKVVTTVSVDTDENILWLRLPLSVIEKLRVGNFLIDVVGTMPDGGHESLMDPEPVAVVNRPTAPGADPEDLPPLPGPMLVPDFSQQFETALED